MKIPLLYFNVKNINGRTYTRDSFKEPLILLGSEEAKTHFYLVEYNNDRGMAPEVNLMNVCGQITDLEIVDDVLLGRFHEIKPVPLKDMIIRPSGTAIVSCDGVVKDYTITKFVIGLAKDDPFKI